MACIIIKLERALAQRFTLWMQQGTSTTKGATFFLICFILLFLIPWNAKAPSVPKQTILQ
jgi:hypothetical protein